MAPGIGAVSEDLDAAQRHAPAEPPGHHEEGPMGDGGGRGSHLRHGREGVDPLGLLLVPGREPVCSRAGAGHLSSHEYQLSPVGHQSGVEVGHTGEGLPPAAADVEGVDVLAAVGSSAAATVVDLGAEDRGLALSHSHGQVQTATPHYFHVWFQEVRELRGWNREQNK